LAGSQRRGTSCRVAGAGEPCIELIPSGVRHRRTAARLCGRAASVS
jgi:hypothetical protein